LVNRCASHAATTEAEDQVKDGQRQLVVHFSKKGREMLLKYCAGNVAQYVVALGIDCLEERIEDVAHDYSRLHHIVIVAQGQQFLSETYIQPKDSFSFVQWHLLVTA
jgi:transcription termination factor Rho